MEPKGLLGHHKGDQHTHYRSPRKGEKGAERIFKEIMTEDYPNLKEYMNLHIQET